MPATAVSTYKKEYTQDGIDAFIRLDGLSAQPWVSGGEVVFEKYYFVKAGSIRCGSYTSHDEPFTETDPRLITFGDVPPLVYSETIGDVLAFAPADSSDGAA